MLKRTLAAYPVVGSFTVILPSLAAALVARLVGAGGDLVRWAFLVFGGILVKSKTCKEKDNFKC